MLVRAVGTIFSGLVPKTVIFRRFDSLGSLIHEPLPAQLSQSDKPLATVIRNYFNIPVYALYDSSTDDVIDRDTIAKDCPAVEIYVGQSPQDVPPTIERKQQEAEKDYKSAQSIIDTFPLFGAFKVIDYDKHFEMNDESLMVGMRWCLDRIADDTGSQSRNSFLLRIFGFFMSLVRGYDVKRDDIIDIDVIHEYILFDK